MDLWRCRERKPAVPVIMAPGHGDVETAVSAMKLGACDFVPSPLMRELSDAVRPRRNRQVGTVSAYQADSGEPPRSSAGAAIDRLLTARKIAERVDRAICGRPALAGTDRQDHHPASGRRDKPFVSQLRGHPRNARGRLFGYEKGAHGRRHEQARQVRARPRRNDLSMRLEHAARPSPGCSVKAGQDRRAGGRRRPFPSTRILSATN
jgi:hypothetical protein